jgi:membrane-bound lytic murein transglycosylase B
MILSFRQALRLEFAMISSVLALTMMTAAAQADPASVPRRSYNICLSNFMRTHLRQGTSETEFDRAVNGACQEQETAFRNAIIERAVALGDRRPVAERDAAAEVEDYRNNAREMFREHKENRTLPD